VSAVSDLLHRLNAQIGEETHIGPWLTIDQERIDRFAAITGDQQWIHIDPVRAAAESPYGTTIAHGFLTLSLLPLLTGGNAPERFARDYPGMRLRVNYGLNKVRFPAPVPCGAQLRARTRLLAVEPLENGLQVTYRITVEIDGNAKPACVVEQLFRLYP
jgi:acyl dehydratase